MGADSALTRLQKQEVAESRDESSKVDWDLQVCKCSTVFSQTAGKRDTDTI